MTTAIVPHSTCSSTTSPCTHRCRRARRANTPHSSLYVKCVVMKCRMRAVASVTKRQTKRKKRNSKVTTRPHQRRVGTNEHTRTHTHIDEHKRKHTDGHSFNSPTTRTMAASTVSSNTKFICQKMFAFFVIIAAAAASKVCDITMFGAGACAEVNQGFVTCFV